MMTIRYLAALLVAAASARGLHAQTTASKRPSFTAGIAAGTVTFHCSQCNSGGRSGPVATGRVAFPVTPAFEIGAEVGYYWKGETHGPDETNDKMTNVVGVVRWLPAQLGGLYVAGGAGYSKFVGQYGTPDQHVSHHDDVSGFALQGTVGYEHAMVSRVGVGVFARGLRTLGGRATSSEPTPFPLPDTNVSLVQFGVTLSWR
jgi:Outer membrane protein beta-barrel domain